MLKYEWYGYIDYLREGGFAAILKHQEYPTIKANFKNTDVSPEEQHRIEENALFRWTICEDGSEAIDFIKITWGELFPEPDRAALAEFDAWLRR